MKAETSPLRFSSEEFTSDHTSSLTAGSLGTGMCRSQSILLPNKHFCARYPALLLRTLLVLLSQRAVRFNVCPLPGEEPPKSRVGSALTNRLYKAWYNCTCQVSPDFSNVSAIISNSE